MFTLPLSAAEYRALVDAKYSPNAETLPGSVLRDKHGYRFIKKTGSAINRTIKQRKAAISNLAPRWLARDRDLRRQHFDL